MPHANHSVVREFHLVHDPDTGTVTVTADAQVGDQTVRWEFTGTYGGWLDQPEVSVREITDDHGRLGDLTALSGALRPHHRVEVKAETTLDVTSAVRRILPTRDDSL